CRSGNVKGARVEGGKVGFAKHNGTCECADRIARIGACANAPIGGRPAPFGAFAPAPMRAIRSARLLAPIVRAWQPGASDMQSEKFGPVRVGLLGTGTVGGGTFEVRSEEHTSELQSRENLVCR